jgi:hypothetical protein
MLNEQDKEYMRHLYAMFAITTQNWGQWHMDSCAEKCFQIADAMMRASEPDQNGIVSVKRKYNQGENDGE